MSAFFYVRNALRFGTSLGWDWLDKSAIDKRMRRLRAEVEELQAAVESGDRAAIADELGDVMIVLVSMSLVRGIDLDVALAAAVTKVSKRLTYIEGHASKDGPLGLDELERLWAEAKKIERERAGHWTAPLIVAVEASIRCRCAAIMREDPTRHFKGCVARDVYPAPGEKGAHAALTRAIRAFTVDVDGGGTPNGEAERQLEVLGQALKRGDLRVARKAYGFMCEASAADTKALRVAAEAFFGDDFRMPPQGEERER